MTSIHTLTWVFDLSLRFGSWNVNGLTPSMFDQIRLFMVDRNNRPQIDILSINETALKPKIPDSLYAVPGFTLHRKDRSGSKKKGGVMVYVNQDLKHKRRTDFGWKCGHSNQIALYSLPEFIAHLPIPKKMTNLSKRILSLHIY